MAIDRESTGPFELKGWIQGANAGINDPFLFLFAKNTYLLMGTYYFYDQKGGNGMINVEKITKYLDESGLGKRIIELKLGDSFGLEIPIDEENGKFLRCWLAVTGETEAEKRLALDFEGILKIDMCMDEKKLEKWATESGFWELGEFGAEITMAANAEEKA